MAKKTRTLLNVLTRIAETWRSARKQPSPERLRSAREQGISERLQLARERQSIWLDLSGTGLSEIPEDVFGLTHIEEIDLSENKLVTIPERLWDLPNLRTVDLVGNPIKSLPNRPGLFIDLPIYLRCHDQIETANFALYIELDLSEEHAVAWAQLITQRNLSDLHIGSFAVRKYSTPSPVIHKIFDSLANLDSLESLSVKGLSLDTVPEGIRHIKGLKYLDLDGLGLRSLPDWIGDLDLEHFSLDYNKLSILPDSFRKLGRLKYLSLNRNLLRQIPTSVFDLVSLEVLGIGDCDIREIPADVLRLPQLKFLLCVGNPIESPPAEVTDHGLKAIRDYWRQRADMGVDYLCEAKLIILGEAGAGKTSLARKIENPNYKLRATEKSTEGIDVIRYQFPSAIRARENGAEKVLKRQFHVNIWDFGGQEIYHATHQFFLTRRSVYVLVCDDRKEDTDFSYWLQVVEMLSDASPLLIVQNEKQDRTRDINLSSLRARFGNLREAIPTNLDTNRGLDRVIQSIRKELENLPHVGVGLPATWKRVREALEQDQRDYISLDEYLNICEQCGFTRHDDKLQLSRLFTRSWHLPSFSG